MSENKANMVSMTKATRWVFTCGCAEARSHISRKRGHQAPKSLLSQIHSRRCITHLRILTQHRIRNWCKPKTIKTQHHYHHPPQTSTIIQYHHNSLPVDRSISFLSALKTVMFD